MSEEDAPSLLLQPLPSTETALLHNPETIEDYMPSRNDAAALQQEPIDMNDADKQHSQVDALQQLKRNRAGDDKKCLTLPFKTLVNSEPTKDISSPHPDDLATSPTATSSLVVSWPYDETHKHHASITLLSSNGEHWGEDTTEFVSTEVASISSGVEEGFNVEKQSQLISVEEAPVDTCGSSPITDSKSSLLEDLLGPAFSSCDALECISTIEDSNIEEAHAIATDSATSLISVQAVKGNSQDVPESELEVATDSNALASVGAKDNTSDTVVDLDFLSSDALGSDAYTEDIKSTQEQEMDRSPTASLPSSTEEMLKITNVHQPEFLKEYRTEEPLEALDISAPPSSVAELVAERAVVVCNDEQESSGGTSSSESKTMESNETDTVAIAKEYISTTTDVVESDVSPLPEAIVPVEDRTECTLIDAPSVLGSISTSSEINDTKHMVIKTSISVRERVARCESPFSSALSYTREVPTTPRREHDDKSVSRHTTEQVAVYRTRAIKLYATADKEVLAKPILYDKEVFLPVPSHSPAVKRYQKALTKSPPASPGISSYNKESEKKALDSDKMGVSDITFSALCFPDIINTPECGLTVIIDKASSENVGNRNNVNCPRDDVILQSDKEPPTSAVNNSDKLIMIADSLEVQQHPIEVSSEMNAISSPIDNVEVLEGCPCLVAPSLEESMIVITTSNHNTKVPSSFDQDHQSSVSATVGDKTETVVEDALISSVVAEDTEAEEANLDEMGEQVLTLSTTSTLLLSSVEHDKHCETVVIQPNVALPNGASYEICAEDTEDVIVANDSPALLHPEDGNQSEACAESCSNDAVNDVHAVKSDTLSVADSTVLTSNAIGGKMEDTDVALDVVINQPTMDGVHVESSGVRISPLPIPTDSGKDSVVKTSISVRDRVARCESPFSFASYAKDAPGTPRGDCDMSNDKHIIEQVPAYRSRAINLYVSADKEVIANPIHSDKEVIVPAPPLSPAMQYHKVLTKSPPASPGRPPSPKSAPVSPGIHRLGEKVTANSVHSDTETIPAPPLSPVVMRYRKVLARSPPASPNHPQHPKYAPVSPGINRFSLKWSCVNASLDACKTDVSEQSYNCGTHAPLSFPDILNTPQGNSVESPNRIQKLQADLASTVSPMSGTIITESSSTSEMAGDDITVLKTSASGAASKEKVKELVNTSDVMSDTSGDVVIQVPSLGNGITEDDKFETPHEVSAAPDVKDNFTTMANEQDPTVTGIDAGKDQSSPLHTPKKPERKGPVTDTEFPSPTSVVTLKDCTPATPQTEQMTSEEIKEEEVEYYVYRAVRAVTQELERVTSHGSPTSKSRYWAQSPDANRAYAPKKTEEGDGQMVLTRNDSIVYEINVPSRDHVTVRGKKSTGHASNTTDNDSPAFCIDFRCCLWDVFSE
jgi:hypothetical protein